MLLVFGSLNVDMLFKVDTLPRPGETVLCPSYELAPGGKGANQAAAAAKAGAEVRMVGHLGADSFGGFTRGEMAKAGVDCASIATSNQATATAVIGVDAAGENQIIVASGANLDTRADQVSDDDLSAKVTLLCQNEITPDATLVLAALLLGFVNAFVRPIAVFLTFPITLVTLGLFLWVVNAGMLGLVAWMLQDFQIADLGSALLGSLVVSLTSWLGSAFIGPRGRYEVIVVRR